MKNIIVPIDFSACSYNAVRYTASLVKFIPAKVTILYVHKPELTVQAMPIGQPYYDLLPVPQQVHVQMKRVKDLLAQKNIECELLVKEGLLSEEILNLAQKSEADLIIMGTEGVTSAYQMLWGTRTSAIISKKEVPVLVVPESYTEDMPEYGEFVLATDLEGLESLPDFYRDLALAANAKVNVFYVKEPYAEKDMKDYEAVRYDLLKKLLVGVSLELHHSYKADVVEAVENFVKRKDAQLITMISHQRSFIEDIFHKSVTKEMALHTTVPFLAVPETKKELNVSVSNSGFF